MAKMKPCTEAATCGRSCGHKHGHPKNGSCSVMCNTAGACCAQVMPEGTPGPVVPEAPKPESVICSDHNRCGMEHDVVCCTEHECISACADMCLKGGRCVPVAAKPDPLHEAMDAAWEKVLDARVSLGALVEDYHAASDDWLAAGAPK